MKLSLSIVIPTYNGLSLLKKHLPSVVKHSGNHPIVIVDDASTDNTVTWLKRTYPQIKILPNKQNLGFGASVNRGFRHAKTNLVFLLNNDVSINHSTIKHASKHFSDPKLFAVGCLEKLPSGKKRGRSTGSFSRGLLIHSKTSQLTKGPTLWVFAASGMFNKKIWHKLGGLDPLFRPAYWEDIDLSYRAWKSGYSCLFEPAATLHHQAEATMNRELGIKKTAYAFKNQLLFFWKNVTSPPLLIAHLLWTPYHLIFTTIRTKGAFAWGFAMALTQLDELTSQPQPKTHLTDLEIIHSINKPT